MAPSTIRASSQAVWVNIGPPRASPVTNNPGAATRCLSTSMNPFSSGFTPRVSSPTSSVLGRLPIATNSASATSGVPPQSSRMPPSVAVTSPYFVPRIKRTPSSSSISWIALLTSTSSRAQDLIARVHDGDLLDPHTAVELAHLHADVAAAQQGEAAREGVLVEPVLGGEAGDRLQAVDLRHQAPGAHVEHDVVGQVALPGDRHDDLLALASGQASVAVDKPLAESLGERRRATRSRSSGRAPARGRSPGGRSGCRFRTPCSVGRGRRGGRSRSPSYSECNRS